MIPNHVLRRVGQRSAHIAGVAFIVSLFLLSGGSVATYVAMHHTAQPEFCNTCHIMDPYYESWQKSKHKDVSCVECHYEPGMLETLGGKVKALNQLSKYLTRTQGTKPWAEVSDQSCLRSGCHSVRTLDGPVQFGDIRFDHRPHLLESRRGRKLRCTSCHSQILQGEHFSVASSVCTTCHFMPGEDGRVSERTGDCLLCHEAPHEEILVAGRPFAHAAYVERGVGCEECHDPVVEGRGTVRTERCQSCHAEAVHLARLGEPAFLHEEHVTDHKVECFECHDEIHHGLLSPEKPPAREGCGACHENAHDAARRLYAGTGAAGVEDSPSRMHQTRVVCSACHTGRSSSATYGAPAHARIPRDEAVWPLHLEARDVHASSVAAAGNVDCIHCHGTGYDGMLLEWQSAVEEQLERLRPMLGELEGKLSAAEEHPANQPLGEARRNLALVALDGSRGAHNVRYALDTLRAGAERIDAARRLLGLEDATPAASEMPFASKEGCTDCHAGAGRPEAIWSGEGAFPHQRHLTVGLECSACHSVAEHGAPAFPRDQCASCHHQESEARDVTDCASCHAPQEALLRGALAGFEPMPSPKSEMECSECHGEPPAILRPKPALCVLCHEPGYDEKQLAWQREIAELTARVETALASPARRDLEAASMDDARRMLEAVQRDGSRGVHNFALAKRLLEQALQRIGGQ